MERHVKKWSMGTAFYGEAVGPICVQIIGFTEARARPGTTSSNLEYLP